MNTIEHEERFGAHNYHPLPVVLTRGEGVHVWDDQGNRYLDMMSAYSAVSHGHCHPRLVKKLAEQAATLAVCSRAFHSTTLAPFLARACTLTGMDKALVMNSGAEAVETALKAARKWGYEAKKIPSDRAEIIVCEGNFHGRTLGMISASTEEGYRKNFEPWLPGVNTAITSARARNIETGSRPPPSALPRISPSGFTPSCWQASSLPVRPRPVWISSAISSAPYLRHKACASRR